MRWIIEVAVVTIPEGIVNGEVICLVKNGIFDIEKIWPERLDGKVRRINVCGG